ncbi:MAG: hypothetical protein U5K72_06585 [Balneolaceae bacterium]|nr:hypothetical protein [Balneolaceae bacterium]
MRKYLLLIFFTGFLICSSFLKSQAQSARLIGENMLNGALTGTILGTATMGLQNSNDFTPLRIGLGSGIIAGTGLAIYDVSTLPKGQQFFISGLFNDGTNSSIIILLDTIYGAGVGAALGSAVMLIGNESILDGLQYGASIGAWSGFGVGLVDSFIIAERNDDFVSNQLLNRSSLFQVDGENTSLSLLQPEIFQYMSASENFLGVDTTPALQLFSVRTSF